MKRKAPKTNILKILYARSGNECAFPGCEHPLFNDNNEFVAQLCHIEAISRGGQRYNESQTDEERNSINNLLFMCHRHHKETDNTQNFPVERLMLIKTEHENKFKEMPKKATKDMILQILIESNYFWNKQKMKKFELEDLKIYTKFDFNIPSLFNELDEIFLHVKNYCEIMAESDSSKLLTDLNTLFDKLGIDKKLLNNVPYYENPFFNRNWELHNMGIPNYFSHLSLYINQLKVKVYEELYKCFPNDTEIKHHLQISRDLFETDFETSYYID
jgi:hypothetical protein